MVARVWGLLAGGLMLAALAPPARADVYASGDANVTVLTNDIGRFFIARRCISSVGGGDPNGAGASIGPGYLSRMDVANKEVLAPEKASVPQTGLGPFQLDLYRDQDRTTPIKASARCGATSAAASATGSSSRRAPGSCRRTTSATTPAGARIRRPTSGCTTRSISPTNTAWSW